MFFFLCSIQEANKCRDRIEVGSTQGSLGTSQRSVILGCFFSMEISFPSKPRAGEKQDLWALRAKGLGRRALPQAFRFHCSFLAASPRASQMFRIASASNLCRSLSGVLICIQFPSVVTHYSSKIKTKPPNKHLRDVPSHLSN